MKYNLNTIGNVWIVKKEKNNTYIGYIDTYIYHRAYMKYYGECPYHLKIKQIQFMDSFYTITNTIGHQENFSKFNQ